MHQYVYDYFLKALSEADMERFEVHLIQCQQCQDELARLDRTLDIMRKDKNFYQEVVERKNRFSKQPIWQQKFFRYAIAAIIFLSIGGFLFSFFSEPQYYELAKLTEETELITLKTESSQNEFEIALNQFRLKNYTAAIEGFNKFLVKQPSHYQAHYFLGLANLAAGETNILWYHHFSTERTQDAIFYLTRAYKLAGDNYYYQEACLWLLGKAWLRLGNWEEAKLAWQKLLEIPSPDLIYRELVRDILKTMD